MSCSKSNIMTNNGGGKWANYLTIPDIVDVYGPHGFKEKVFLFLLIHLKALCFIPGSLWKLR